MSYYNSGSSSAIYGLEEHRHEEERKNAPQQCPYCKAPINQNLQRWDRVRYHCGSARCRQAASRQNRAEQLKQEREEARERILAYCNQCLTDNQRFFVMLMFDQLAEFNPKKGHKIAETVVSTIEDKRCKHDRISQLEQNALLWQRKAEASERQLKERIAELEAELELFNALHNTIHGIAIQQQKIQPDQEERPRPVPQTERPDPDRARVLKVLAQAGIPSTGEEEDLEE
jgi:hypothetical protein